MRYSATKYSEIANTLRQSDKVQTLSLSSDGKIAISGSERCNIRVWNTINGKLIHTLKGHRSSICKVHINKNNKIISSSSRGEIIIWDALNGTMIKRLEGHVDYTDAVYLGNNDRIAVSGSDDQTVRIWDVSENTVIRLFNDHRQTITGVALNLSLDIAISSSNDKTIRLWDISKNRLTRILRGHTNNITDISFCEENSLLVSSSEDRTIRLWNIESASNIRVLEGHTNTVIKSIVSGNGKVIASCSLDRTIRIWDAESGRCLKIFYEFASSLAINYDGTVLISGINNHIKVWNLHNLLQKSYNITTLSYTSAKVVLLGESNVGKSCLALRIAEDKYEQQDTTHGMRFWPIAPEQLHDSAIAPTNQQRDIIFWDLGGQEEYRLIHQLFLHDTTIALILFDPKRGETAFKEVEEWNMRLQRRIGERKTSKILVGSKCDTESSLININAVNALKGSCGFSDYLDVSAKNSRNISRLKEMIAESIDWNALSHTSRPELFQKILDEIDNQRKSGKVVIELSTLEDIIQTNFPNIFEVNAVDTVTNQLAAQGIIARTNLSNNASVLILRIEEVERYGGSLIVLARNNLRGIPALEISGLRSITDFPGIPNEARLGRIDELVVVECVAQLLISRGICFVHANLMIFPSLFKSGEHIPKVNSPDSVSLYYDFSGAIDNIYASLITILGHTQMFGPVRLWENRAEFEVAGKGVCGLAKTSKGGGFAHLDIYFDKHLNPTIKSQFITFVEQHLNENGVEIFEHISIKCSCGYNFDESSIQRRRSEGKSDIGCPSCDKRHSIERGSTEIRQADPTITKSITALRSNAEKHREKSIDNIHNVFLKREDETLKHEMPIHILHISDLHFKEDTSPSTKFEFLRQDLKVNQNVHTIEYLVISGDFTDKGNISGFEHALEFLKLVINEFDISADRCILVPGNHDIPDNTDNFDIVFSRPNYDQDYYSQQGEIYLLRSPHKYRNRFKTFSDEFFHKFMQESYPLDEKNQGFSYFYPSTNIQFLTFNSCFRIDKFRRQASGISIDSVAHVISQADKQIKNKSMPLRIAVWHHAVSGANAMKDLKFLNHLQNASILLGLHGDVHEMRRESVGNYKKDRINIIGAGSFSSSNDNLSEGSPRLYNLIKVNRNLDKIRVHTRSQSQMDGSWESWAQWTNPIDPNSFVDYYDLDLTK